LSNKIPKNHASFRSALVSSQLEEFLDSMANECDEKTLRSIKAKEIFYQVSYTVGLVTTGLLGCCHMIFVHCHMTSCVCHMTSHNFCVMSHDFWLSSQLFILLTMYRVVYQELGIQSFTLWPENSGWFHVYWMISLIANGCVVSDVYEPRPSEVILCSYRCALIWL